ncbi:MAG: hypothetical protein ACR2NZ_16375 [Rubripirellula sp.]
MSSNALPTNLCKQFLAGEQKPISQPFALITSAALIKSAEGLLFTGRGQASVRQRQQ